CCLPSQTNHASHEGRQLMSPWRQHMLAALPLSGTSARPPASSVREVHLLAPCDHQAPDRMPAQARQRYGRHRNHGDGLAPAPLPLSSSGLRFFSPPVLQRDGSPRSLRRAHTTPRLPAVLRGEEGQCLLASAPPCHHPASCPTVSRFGRRRPAALFLP